MRIKDFIKNYPVTIFLIFLFSIGIFIISVDSNIHATPTKPECEEVYYSCNTGSDSGYNCKLDKYGLCYCPGPPLYRRNCQRGVAILCKSKEPPSSGGCGNGKVSDPCYPLGCYPPQNGYCGLCEVYRIMESPCDPCTKCHYTSSSEYVKLTPWDPY